MRFENLLPVCSLLRSASAALAAFLNDRIHPSGRLESEFLDALQVNQMFVLFPYFIYENRFCLKKNLFIIQYVYSYSVLFLYSYIRLRVLSLRQCNALQLQLLHRNLFKPSASVATASTSARGTIHISCVAQVSAFVALAGRCAFQEQEADEAAAAAAAYLSPAAPPANFALPDNLREIF